MVEPEALRKETVFACVPPRSCRSYADDATSTPSRGLSAQLRASRSFEPYLRRGVALIVKEVAEDFLYVEGEQKEFFVAFYNMGHVLK